jgi:hypothetical protein
MKMSTMAGLSRPARFSLAAASLAALVVLADGGAGDRRLEEIEGICGYVTSCDADEIAPTPDVVIDKYHMTTQEVVGALIAISRKYGLGETNDFNRLTRQGSVAFIGRYGGTNELPYLAAIMTNRADYAHEEALGASININRHSPALIPLVREIVTNTNTFSRGARQWTYIILQGMCDNGGSDMYIDDSAQHARIAAFFIERAGVEHEFVLDIDDSACRMNPWYRHSQQRRSNLAAMRPPGLTGRPAEIYDAAQRDAAQGNAP